MLRSGGHAEIPNALSCMPTKLDPLPSSLLLPIPICPENQISSHLPIEDKKNPTPLYPMKSKISTTMWAVSCLVIIRLAAFAQAGSITWSNAANNFNSGSNWTDGVAPGAENVASFSVTAAVQPQLTASTTIQGLSFTGTGYTLSSNSGANKLTLTNATGFIAGSSNATISANLELGAATGATQSATHSGTTTISGNITEANSGIGLALNGGANGVLLLSGTNTFTGDVRIQGTVRVDGVTKTLGNQGSTTSVMGGGTTVFLGNSTSAGTLDYRGGGETTNRIFSLAGTTGGGTIQANGNPALLKLTSNLEISGIGDKVFELGGGSTVRNEFAGGIGDGAGSVVSLRKNGASGVWVVSNPNNTFSGNVSIVGGFLNVTRIGNQGSTTSNLGSGTRIDFNHAPSTGGLRYEGTGETTDRIINLAGTTNGGQIINNVTGGGNLIFTSALTTTGNGDKTVVFSGSGNGEFQGNIVDSPGFRTLVAKTGSGTWSLTGNKTYSGSTSITSSSVLSVDSLADGGSPSSIGQSSNAASNLVFDNNLATTLRYTGSGSSTDRLFSIRGTGAAVLEANGTGPVLFTNTGAVAYTGTANGNRSITLSGTNTGANTLAASIADNGSGLVSVNKSGPGTWVLTHPDNTYTGNTAVTGGTLRVSGSISNSAVTVSGTGTILASGATGTIGKGVTISNSAILAPGGLGSVGVATVGTNGLNLNAGSVFDWDLTSSSTSSGFDTLSVAGAINVSSTNTIFRVVLSGSALAGIQDSANTFWNTPNGIRSWSLSSIFGKAINSGTFASVQTGTDVSEFGSFSISGSTLTWTAVPDPNSVPVTANAGSDIQLNAPTMTAILNGSITGGTAQWSQVSGPGTVVFANASSAVTTAQFPQLGTYVLRLTTTGQNAVAVSDEVTVNLVDPTVVTPLEAQTVARLKAWGELKEGNDPVKGRPLPLAASWAAGASHYSRIYAEGRDIGHPVHDSFVLDPLLGPGPDRMVQEIKQGKHVMITFEDVLSAGGVNRPTSRFNEPGFVQYFDNYYRPALLYAKTHKLPIAIRGWNWAVTLVDIENGVAGRGRPTRQLGPDDTAKLIKNGTVFNKLADPFGPIGRWQEFGQIWMGHEVMRRIQEIYPDPPMVVFINNNEVGQITDAASIDDTTDRYVAQHGTGTTLEFRARMIREGYAERYAALFASARAAFVETAWRDNVRFIAYNNQPTQILGRNEMNWNRRIGFDPNPGPGFGFSEHRKYDGGTPEYYDNHWQAPNKGDWSPWSPQAEASNMIAYQDARVWAENPNFYWSSSLWGGDMPSNLSGQPGRYINDDGSPFAKWDMNRYNGMLQFGLWILRPREYREFRGEDDLRGFNGLAWNELVQSVDRVWNNATLTEFWKFGKLVHNPVFGTREHYFSSTASMPTLLREMDRWFLLTSNVNPAESTWPEYWTIRPSNALKVFALALSLGEAPNRRWLIYAHAPLGSVAGSSVTLPGIGSVVLDYIPRSGSFFTVNEGSLTATALLRGGPAEIALTPSARHIVPGASVTVSAALRHPPATAITGYTWRVPGEADRTSATLVNQTYTFPTPGEKMITLEAATADGATVVEQVSIWVRPSPPTDGVVLDMPLRSAYSWSGPWGTDLQSGALQTFRYQPNASNSFDRESVLRGGNIVNDPEEGNVLEVRTALDGVIATRSSRTILNSDGHSNMAVSFRFKAEDVQRRQLLYSQGADGRPGISIYLQGGQIFAGSWLSNWLGEWISAPVIASRWYEVRFALTDATIAPRAGVASLTLDGVLAGTASGARLPIHYQHPRLSVAGMAVSVRSATSANADGVTLAAVAGSLLGVIDSVTRRPRDHFTGRLADFTFATGAGLSAGQRYVQMAVNVAGGERPGSTGIPFEADTGGTNGTTGELPPALPSEAVTDPEIYRTYRFGAAFSYNLPVPNGSYNVRLMFLEPDDRSTPRLFNVDLEGSRILTNFNVQAEAGAPRQAFDRSFPVSVSDGTLNLSFVGVAGTEAVLSGFVIEKLPLTTPGLIGHWRFDEKSGATALDTSGRDRDLSFPSVNSWQDGAVFSGASTPQASTSSLAAAQFSLGSGNKLTASLWVRPIDMTGRSGTILWHGSTQAGIRIALDNQRRLVTEIDNINPSTPLIATRALSNGRWYHVAVVYDGALSSASSRLRLYIDGKLDRTGTEASTTLPNHTARLFVGQRNDRTDDPKFTGNLRDLRLITEALTPAEIESIASVAPLGAGVNFIDTAYSPDQLTGTATASLTEINLSWLPVRGAISYNVKRSTTSGGPYGVIASGITATTYSDTGLSPNQRYYYVVTANTALGESPENNEIFRSTQPDIIVDNTDAGFTANTSAEWSGIASVGTWLGSNYRRDSTAGADPDTRWARWTPTIPIPGNYQVFMRWPANSVHPVAAPVEIVHANGTDTTQTVNQRLNDGVWVSLGSYFFAAGNSSATGSVRILATDTGNTAADAIKLVYLPHLAPLGLAATAISPSQINLSWTDNADNESGFAIERSSTGTGGWSQIATTGANATNYSNTGLPAGTRYFYRIRAFFPSSNSPYSNSADALTLSSNPPPIGGEQIIVDNSDVNSVTFSGSWTPSTWTGGGSFVGADYLFTASGSSGFRSATYRPTLAAAMYEVFINYSNHSNRASNVPVTVNYSGGSETILVNMRVGGGQWRSLGVFPFSSGTEGNVVIANTGTNGFVIADAIRFARIDPSAIQTQLDNWRVANFTAADLANPAKEPTVWGSLADPDNDGLNNLLEYALGQSPLVAQTAGLPILETSSGGRMTFTFQRDPSLTDIDYIVEASPDLTSWTPIAASTGGRAMQKLEGAFAVAETGAPLKAVTVEDNELISAATKRYLRLRIQRP